MNTVIRCHIKNKQRLDTLEREIRSWYAKGLNQFGELFIVDDGSPMQNDVILLSKSYSATYFRTLGTPDTKNGLYWSLKIQNKFPVFCCVDDAIFGNGIQFRILKLLNMELPIIQNFGMVGTFACYEDNTRNSNKVLGTDLWKVPTDILYALVAHLFSKELSDIIVNSWDKISLGTEPMPNCCDDLWVKSLLKKNNMFAYNTMKDYAQHTGGDNRTFGESGSNSNYYTKMFVGE